MKITAKVFKSSYNNKIKASASITVDDSLVITGLKVIDGNKGLFVSMPNYKTKDGEYKDSVFPLSKELRQQIQEVVLKEYGGENIDDGDEFPF